MYDVVHGPRLVRERSDVLTLFLVGSINRVPGEGGGGRVNYINNEYT